MKITEDVLNIIENDDGHNSSTCRRKMFSKWLTSNTNASYADLVDALVVINKKDVAENVSQEFCKYLYHLSTVTICKDMDILIILRIRMCTYVRTRYVDSCVYVRAVRLT